MEPYIVIAAADGNRMIIGCPTGEGPIAEVDAIGASRLIADRQQLLDDLTAAQQKLAAALASATKPPVAVKTVT